jgi:hypothetical protein
MRILELNQDGSQRLDDNGEPIIISIPDWQYYRLIETPIGKKRYRLVEDVTELKVEKQKTTRKGTK